MKRKLLTFFFIACYPIISFSQQQNPLERIFPGSTTAAGQEGLVQFTHNYFRSDPFKGEFSSFLQHLLNDPGIANKQTQPRTDSSLFYFIGDYKNYNPFFFKPQRVEVMLEEAPLSYSDSTAALDTVLIYQLNAYTNNDSKGISEVKKEFEKIHRQYNKKFFDSNSKESKKDEGVVGASHSYFVPYHALAPLSVAWGTTADSNEAILNITLRITKKQNRAALITSFNNP